MKLTHNAGNMQVTYDFKRELLCISQDVEGGERSTIAYSNESMEKLHELIETVLESNKYQNRSK